MPSEAQSVRLLDMYSASKGIDGGTGCNFIFFRIDIVSSNRRCRNIFSALVIQWIPDIRTALGIGVKSGKAGRPPNIKPEGAEVLQTSEMFSGFLYLYRRIVNFTHSILLYN